MLVYQSDFSNVRMSADDVCNRTDGEILTHARMLLQLISESQQALEQVETVLKDRRTLIEDVLFQIQMAVPQSSELVK